VAEERLTLAVVVPTYRRPQSLERCLRALAAQSVPADRVVVVVREGDADTEAEVERLRAETLAFERASVDEPGVVAAIDAGIAASTEDVVAVTDDDAAPHPDWLERLRANYGAGIGGVGGRDLIERPSHVSRRQDPIVGRLTWFGRLHGNHHLGVGAPRDVDVLKGVNMSLRRELWQLDTTLHGSGAQVHWEVAVGLRAKSLGWRLVYDPLAQVEHTPAIRYDADDRTRPTRDARLAAEWNYAYVLGRYLPAWRLPFAGAYLIGVGTRGAPGVAAFVANCASRPRETVAALRFLLTLNGTRVSALSAGIRTRS
jgi:glycosyltransferase involved in cell wall biosynthesis